VIPTSNQDGRQGKNRKKGGDDSPHLPFKMAAVTKNRKIFNCPLLLYYESK
jgi:hypothetical protein